MSLAFSPCKRKQSGLDRRSASHWQMGRSWWAYRTSHERGMWAMGPLHNRRLWGGGFASLRREPQGKTSAVKTGRASCPGALVLGEAPVSSWERVATWGRGLPRLEPMGAALLAPGVNSGVNKHWLKRCLWQPCPLSPPHSVTRKGPSQTVPLRSQPLR